MKKELFLNRHTFTYDRFNEYKRFCERIATSKTSCRPSPPPIYPFLSQRMKRKEAEKERQHYIRYNLKLLNDKYIEMNTKNGKYHPKNMKSFPHPKSLRFSNFRHEIYEKTHQNMYLGNKLRMIKSAKSAYDTKKYLNNYKHLKYIEGNINSNSKYTNFFLDLVTPFTYEKRLNSLVSRSDKKPYYYTFNFPVRKNNKSNSNRNVISIDREYVGNKHENNKEENKD